MEENEEVFKIRFPITVQVCFISPNNLLFICAVIKNIYNID